jgi:hypothetical protein
MGRRRDPMPSERGGTACFRPRHPVPHPTPVRRTDRWTPRLSIVSLASLELWDLGAPPGARCSPVHSSGPPRRERWPLRARTVRTLAAEASAVPADASLMTPVATNSVAWGRTSLFVATSVVGPGLLTAGRLRRRATREVACRLATSAARTPVEALLAVIAAGNARVARSMRASLSTSRIFCRRCGCELQYVAP